MNHSPPPQYGPRTVRRRIVFYVHGFDPRGPAWYNGTYRRNAARQAELTGMRISVSDRQKRSGELTAWGVDAETGGVVTSTDYHFLRWDDIVRCYWPRGTLRLWGVMWRNLREYISSGVLWRLFKTSWPTFICAFFPSAFVLLLALSTLLLGVGFGAVLAGVAGWPSWSIAPVAVAASLACTAAGTPLLDRWFSIHWLTRIYAFNRLQARRQAPELDRRFDEFAHLVARKSRDSGADEILIVGHSTGAQGAVALIGRSLEIDPDLGRHGPRLSFMTVGSSISMLSWQPEAEWFRAALKRVASEPDLDWIDFTIAQDGACFALHDPVQSAGLAHPQGGEPKPKLLSVRLFDLFSPDEFKRIRRNWYQVHFQYLMATQRAGDYDYFAITAGPLTLADRFAHRETTRNFDRFKLKVFG